MRRAPLPLPPALADYSINHKQTRRGARPPALRKSLGSGETRLQLQSAPSRGRSRGAWALQGGGLWTPVRDIGVSG